MMPRKEIRYPARQDLTRSSPTTREGSSGSQELRGRGNLPPPNCWADFTVWTSTVSVSAGDSFLLLGFVYFEFDCWSRLRNPYIPLDVANPTLHQDLQRNLQGEGRAERLQVIADCNKEYHECRKTGADPSSSQAVRRWVEMNSEDILRERRRIGGDWAIAGCLTHRSTRDTLRRANISVLQSLHTKKLIDCALEKIC